MFRASTLVTLLLVLAEKEVLAEVLEVPPKKQFKNAYFIHKSTLSRKIVFTGESIILSNHVTKMGYNIAGRKQVILISPAAKSTFGENKNKTNKIEMLTDKSGTAVTNFTLNRSGTFVMDVLFMNRKSGYYEHIVKHEMKVIDQRRWIFYTAMILLLLLTPSVLLKVFNLPKKVEKIAETNVLLPFNLVDGILFFRRGANYTFNRLHAGLSLGLGLFAVIGYVLNQVQVVIVFFWLLGAAFIATFKFAKFSKCSKSLMLTPMLMVFIATLFLLIADNFLLTYGNFLTDCLTRMPSSFKYGALLMASFVFPPYMWGPWAGFLYKVGFTWEYLLAGGILSIMPTLALCFKANKKATKEIEK